MLGWHGSACPTSAAALETLLAIWPDCQQRRRAGRPSASPGFPGTEHHMTDSPTTSIPLPPLTVGGWLTARAARLISQNGLHFVHECTPAELAQLPSFGPLTIHQIQRWIATHQFTEGTISDTDENETDSGGRQQSTGSAAAASQPAGRVCGRSAADTGHHSWRHRRQWSGSAAGDDNTAGSESAAAAETEPAGRHVPEVQPEVDTPPASETLTEFCDRLTSKQHPAT